MYVLDCPRVQRTEVGTGLVWVPDLPVGVRFGQASSALDDLGRQLVYLVGANPSDVKACVDRGCVVVRDSNGADIANTARMRTELERPNARWISEAKPKRNQKLAILRTAHDEGRQLTLQEQDSARVLTEEIAVIETDCIDNRLRSVRSEFIGKYDEAAAPFVAARRTRDQQAQAIKIAKSIVAGVGFIAAAVFLSKALGLPYALALTVLHSDSFNRSNRSLSGDTMSDSVGAWATQNASYPKIVSNQAAGDSAGGNWYGAYDSVQTAVAEHRATATWLDWLSQICVRMDSSFNGYACDARAGSTTIYKATPIGSFSNLGSGSGVSTNDTIAADADTGNNITFLVNGSAAVGPVSDSTYTTGVGGIATNGAFISTGLLDAWQVEIAGGATGNPWYYYAQQG